MIEIFRLLLDARNQYTLGFGLECVFFDDDIQLAHLSEASRDEKIHKLNQISLLFVLRNDL